MSFGFGFGFTKITAAIRAAFSPSSLFAANEPGVWYDPGDFSTLFQDDAGTTPVTAVEQPVGLMLDKRLGLVRGPELVTNGGFDNGTTGWVLINTPSVVTESSSVVVTNTANTSGYEMLAQAFGSVAGKTYECVFDVEPLTANTAVGAWTGTTGAYSVNLPLGRHTVRRFFTATNANAEVRVGAMNTDSAALRVHAVSVRELPGNHAYQTTATSRPVLSARVNQYLATETLATQNITTLAAQYRLSFEGAGTITLSGTATGVYSAGSHLITCTTGTLTSTVSGSVTKADLRVANTGVNLPPYQRVNTATDYDTDGFPHYLRFDGVDDWLVTPTITPGIDKAQVFAGVRKLSDAAIGTVLGLGASLPPRGFEVFESDTGGGSGSNNTSFNVVMGNASFFNGDAAPFSRIAAILLDRSLPRATETSIRSNGNNKTLTILGSDATSTFLAYPLYIGRRGGTSLPFNGHLYSLIVRFGSNLPIETIEQTEAWINGKTGAY